MILTLTAITNTRAWDISCRAVGATFLAIFDAAAFSAILKGFRRLDATTVDVGAVAALLAHLCLFSLLLIETTLILARLRPVAKAAGMQARISALLGTWLMLAIVVFPIRNDLSPFAYIFSSSLGLLGDLLAIYVVVHLGGSFSFMAEARLPVMHGPYAIVRHPLYLAEEVGLASAVVTHLSHWAVALFVTQVLFQYLRARNEEHVLAQTFPEYAAYMKHTPMLMPRLGSLRCVKLSCVTSRTRT